MKSKQFIANSLFTFLLIALGACALVLWSSEREAVSELKALTGRLESLDQNLRTAVAKHEAVRPMLSSVWRDGEQGSLVESASRWGVTDEKTLEVIKTYQTHLDSGTTPGNGAIHCS